MPGARVESAAPLARVAAMALEPSGGMIELLDRMSARRKILIHINNSNPILREDSAERALLRQHGIEVAFDGMEISL